jgi:hypothetical protein
MQSNRNFNLEDAHQKVEPDHRAGWFDAHLNNPSGGRLPLTATLRQRPAWCSKGRRLRRAMARRKRRPYIGTSEERPVFSRLWQNRVLRPGLHSSGSRGEFKPKQPKFPLERGAEGRGVYGF